MNPTEGALDFLERINQHNADRLAELMNAFGAEASPVALVVCLVAGIALIALAIKKGHVVPSYWARKHASRLKQQNAAA